jgi:hypothetical protein
MVEEDSTVATAGAIPNQRRQGLPRGPCVRSAGHTRLPPPALHCQGNSVDFVIAPTATTPPTPPTVPPPISSGPLHPPKMLVLGG